MTCLSRLFTTYLSKRLFTSTEQRAKQAPPGGTASARSHLAAMWEDVLHTSEWIKFFH